MPGAGKTVVLKLCRAFFEDVSFWTHGFQFVFLASFNTMAARLDGFTAHSFGGIPITEAQREANFDSKGRRPDVNEAWKRINALRFLFIDEASAVGAEDVGALEKNMRDGTQLINWYKPRPRRRRRGNFVEANIPGFWRDQLDHVL